MPTSTTSTINNFSTVSTLADNDQFIIWDTSGSSTAKTPTSSITSLVDLTDFGITATSTELNYSDGVTSNIQTQLDAKIASLTDLGITATSTELNYVDGVTSAIQTQIDAKLSDITGEAIGSLSDVTITSPADNEVMAYNSATSTWINQTASEAGLAATSHTHTASDITDFDTEVSNNTDVAANTSARHSAVTLAGSLDYITLSGQQITRNAIDLTTDVTGFLPVGNVVTSTNATSTTFLRGDGTWATPSGSGDVSKVGTPVDNQIGIWTGDGTIEGDSKLTFTSATSTLAVTGNITVTGNVDGRDVSADGSKLDGIESGADVTDTTNVTAAGALMDSEVSSLSGIKTLTVPDNTTISTFGASLVDDTTAAAARTTLGAGTLSNVVEDTTPQLGGNLDGGANDISINAGQKFILDGSGGNTYLTYNSSTAKLELWVDGVKKMQWG